MTGVKAVLLPVLCLFFEMCVQMYSVPVAGIHGRIRLGIKYTVIAFYVEVFWSQLGK